MSESPLAAPKPKSSRRDRLLGSNTLSSLALPTREAGSCSRNMLNLCERLAMRRLVRKSSFEGKATERSISGFTSGSSFGLRLLFFHLLVALFLTPGEGSGGVELC